MSKTIHRRITQTSSLAKASPVPSLGTAYDTPRSQYCMSVSNPIDLTKADAQSDTLESLTTSN